MAHISHIQRCTIVEYVTVGGLLFFSHLRPHSLSSHPGSLVADWCVILIGSFCAASESITLSVNGWSTVGGGSAEGSQSLSPELSQLTAHLPAPSLWCDIYSKYPVHPLMQISGVFLYFSLLFLIEQQESKPASPCVPVCLLSVMFQGSIVALHSCK